MSEKLKNLNVEASRLKTDIEELEEKLRLFYKDYVVVLEEIINLQTSTSYMDIPKTEWSKAFS